MDEIIGDVRSLMTHDDSGHGYDHVDRVLKLSLEFAEKEGANPEVVTLLALLHEVDDYKFVGEEEAGKLSNAKRIMTKHGIARDRQTLVIESLQRLGYSNYLDGIRPTSIEGMVVSDADMCDATGSVGIYRAIAFGISRGRKLFDPELVPSRVKPSAKEHRAQHDKSRGHSVGIFFDRLLKTPSLMLTESGRQEALKRQKVMVSFLDELFREHKTPEWQEFLDRYRSL